MSTSLGDRWWLSSVEDYFRPFTNSIKLHLQLCKTQLPSNFLNQEQVATFMVQNYPLLVVIGSLYTHNVTTFQQ